MVTFYRLENEKGEGVYTDGAGFLAASLATSSWNHNPPDVEFDQFYISRDQCDTSWYFGFSHLNVLYRWFDTVEAISHLEMCGIRIVKYEIEHRYFEKSKTQCIFKKGFEKRIEEIDFNYDRLNRKEDLYNKVTQKTYKELMQFIHHKLNQSVAV